MIERMETSRLNRNLGEVLDKIEAGHSIILTRYKKDVAVIAPLPINQVALDPKDLTMRETTPTFTDAVADPAKPGRATVSTTQRAQAARDAILNESRKRPNG
jgi:antitoxin (DNA-binding transcriptional repressor) of toxin-antitoxin stability system